ncbi:hypothetical protein [Geobacter sp. AOG2]|uniref:hypothetical protein n=1 Tax=Geobacter sp. AOG2 TaxID=1566347 RepID=UPI001CC400DA|nr:hypothetical protein [Geobacter sp. AOG2]GFE62260.1 hypothetical protein AOG2_28480 [Geobacter sp. AOG2]
MKLGKVLVMAAAVVALASGSAMATFSGQIWIPSTDVKGFKEVNLSVDNYIRFSDAVDAGANTYDIGVTTGVLPLEKFKVEVGVDYMTDNLGSGDNGAQHPIYFNFKGGVPEDAFFKGMPAVAAGMYGIGTFDRGTNGNTMGNVAYGLIAKTFPVIGRLSVGGYNGAEKNLGSKTNNGLLASWDRTMSEISDKLWLAVDYQSGNNALGALSVGGSWAFTPTVSLLVGANFYNPFYNPQGGSLPGGKPTFTTQVDFNF